MRRYRVMDDTVRPQARATLAPHGPHRLLLPFLELVVAWLYVLPIGAAAGVIVREVKLR